MHKTNSSQELTVPHIPVMTFDEIVAVKDFRKKKEPPLGSAHSSDADKMPAINNGTSPDKTKSTSPVKRDLQSNHLNSYTDITDQVFGALANKETAQRYIDIRREITYLDHDNER